MKYIKILGACVCGTERFFPGIWLEIGKDIDGIGARRLVALGHAEWVEVEDEDEEKDNIDAPGSGKGKSSGTEK